MYLSGLRQIKSYNYWYLTIYTKIKIPVDKLITTL